MKRRNKRKPLFRTPTDWLMMIFKQSLTEIVIHSFSHHHYHNHVHIGGALYFSCAFIFKWCIQIFYDLKKVGERQFAQIPTDTKRFLQQITPHTSTSLKLRNYSRLLVKKGTGCEYSAQNDDNNVFMINEWNKAKDAAFGVHHSLNLA